MSAWGDVALVLAGSAGPLAIAAVNIRSDRDKERVRAEREESLRRQDNYARFVASATTVVADWCDYALIPPRTTDEERLLDDRRDAHYADLNAVAATIRLTATPAVVAAAEDLLAVVRDARSVAREVSREADRDAATARWGDVDARFAAARAAFVAAGRR
jgi:hypothetical protein